MEVKTFPFAELKVAGEGAGTFEGRASTFGTVDSYGDRIAPGAYAETIPQFLTRGFIGWGHDWANPIGMVLGAEERKDGLWIEGQFHSDPDAQKYRLRAKERVASDKFMGLSIGFQAEAWHYEDEGAVRVLDKIHLFEVSLVSVPAEQNSQVLAVKGYGLDFDEHTEAFISPTRVAFDEWWARCEAGSAERVKAGKSPISEARRSPMETVRGSLRQMWEMVDAKLTDSAPPAQQEEPEQDAPASDDTPATSAEDAELIARHLRQMARYRTALPQALPTSG